jgi:hypothetical protein
MYATLEILCAGSRGRKRGRGGKYRNIKKCTIVSEDKSKIPRRFMFGFALTASTSMRGSLIATPRCRTSSSRPQKNFQDDILSRQTGIREIIQRDRVACFRCELFSPKFDMCSERKKKSKLGGGTLVIEGSKRRDSSSCEH